MDVQMPRMDGIETTTAIRNREKSTGGYIPIVALTAHAMVGDRERCLKAGMDGYLIKPIQPATLLEAIEQLHLASATRSKSERADKIVLDRETFARSSRWRHAVARRNYTTFLRECDPLMASAREAMKTGNAGRFAYDIHTLRGCSAAFPLPRRRKRREDWRTRFGEESGQSAGGLRVARAGSASAQGRTRRDDRQDGRFLGVM